MGELMNPHLPVSSVSPVLVPALFLDGLTACAASTCRCARLRCTRTHGNVSQALTPLENVFEILQRYRLAHINGTSSFEILDLSSGTRLDDCEGYQRVAGLSIREVVQLSRLCNFPQSPRFVGRALLVNKLFLEEAFYTSSHPTEWAEQLQHDTGEFVGVRSGKKRS